MTTTELRVEIPVGHLDVRLRGPEDGPTVLLLHGFPQDARSWDAVARALARTGIRTATFDQRGYTPDARPDDDAAYRLDALTDDVETVAAALGAERYHVAGHDWGGAVAWSVAARAPDGLAGVTALSTPHPAAMAWAFRYGDQMRRSAYMPIFASRLGPGLLGGAGAIGLRGLFAGSGLSRRLAAPYVERARQDPGWLAAALGWYRANDVSALAIAERITMPMLYVWGTDDPALGPAAAYRTGRHVTGPYRFVALPGMGHWLPELAADAVARLVAEHVRAHA